MYKLKKRYRRNIYFNDLPYCNYKPAEGMPVSQSAADNVDPDTAVVVPNTVDPDTVVPDIAVDPDIAVPGIAVDRASRSSAGHAAVAPSRITDV